MKKTMMHYAYIFMMIGIILPISSIHAKKSNEIPMNRFDDSTTAVAATKEPEASFLFQFNNEDIVNIINLIAAAKDINLILPQGGKAMKDIKVTFHLDDPVTVDRAWDLLGTLLDVAGYSIK